MFKDNARTDNTQRLLAICGIIGPVSYVIVLITLGSLEPGYSHVTQTMSKLGAPGARYPLIMNTAGFALLGLLMVALALGLDRGIRDGKGSKIGPGLVAVSGAAVVTLGFFHSEPGAEDPTAMGTMHSVFVLIAGFALLLAPLAISPRLKRDERWRGYVAYSLVTVVVASVVAVLYSSNVFESWKGIIQRMAMAVPFIWLEVMAIKLLRVS
jgi:hypothetical membrane protein